MSKTLVTGAGGFIGSHLVEALVDEGHAVKALIRYNSRNNWGYLETSKVRDKIEVVAGDIRDFDSVRLAMRDCDHVFHLAALIGIPYSYESPLAYIRTNIEGTYNVLQNARDHDIDNILITSTSETYGSAQYVPIDEHHECVGQSPYSASKIAADQIALSFYRSFDLPVKVVRPFNTYGPRQSARAIIPTIISQILSGQENIHLGNLTPTRDLTYVKDTVQGFLAIAAADELAGEVTNIGMGDEISMGDLASFIARIMSVQIKITSDDSRIRPDKSEVDRLFCANSKLKSKTDWSPKYTLETGLLETIDWMKKNMALFKAHVYNI